MKTMLLSTACVIWGNNILEEYMAFGVSSHFIGFTVAADTPHWAFKSSGRPFRLTHWGRVTHICVAYLTIIASDNGLSPSRRQAIIWTNAGILIIRRLGTNFSEILIEIHTFSFKKMHLKMSSAKRRPFCLGLNVLKSTPWLTTKVFLL